jgi:hypothetical protein
MNIIREKDIDQTRILLTGVNNPRFDDNELLKEILSDTFYVFSVNTAIWKTISYLELCRKFSDRHYRNIEYADVQDYTRTNLKNYYLSTSQYRHSNCDSRLSNLIPIIHVTSSEKWWWHNILNPPYFSKYTALYNIDFTKRTPCKEN